MLKFLAVAMFTSVFSKFNACSQTGKARDCADLYLMGCTKSGVYTIYPLNRLFENNRELVVYCDMATDGGGWTVIQRRGNFSRPANYFYKNWDAYEEGFGDVEKSFWLGNDNIFALANMKLNSVRFDLKDHMLNHKYAVYDTFWIDDKLNQYTLRIADYSGNAGDSMTAMHNNRKFSTKDKKNDINKNGESCALKYKGAWWYSNCLNSNLNGMFLKGKHDSYGEGIVWTTWKGYEESLYFTEIKIRPKNYKLMLKKTTR